MSQLDCFRLLNEVKSEYAETRKREEAERGPPSSIHLLVVEQMQGRKTRKRKGEGGEREVMEKLLDQFQTSYG
jgi:hypothetical protein